MIVNLRSRFAAFMCCDCAIEKIALLSSQCGTGWAPEVWSPSRLGGPSLLGHLPGTEGAFVGQWTSLLQIAPS
jgi:hypothetical protein